VAEDWASVAKAINERVHELGLRQRDLIERSQVSPAIVREIQRHSVERRRSARTLESLSITLGWHPQHLDAVLHGRRPPSADELGPASEAALMARIDEFEHRMTERLDELTTRLDALKSDLATVMRNVRPHK
jgi:transcriptional regulator with XRE-family HTH domain